MELKPEIIILDLVMPVMDGLTAAREIVKLLPAVPIVIHTVHFSEELKWEAIRSACERCYRRPTSRHWSVL